MTYSNQEPYRAAIPADIERADRILGPFTLRQVALLAGTGLVLYGLWAITARVVPTLVFLAAATPVMAVALVLALARRDGLPLDAWLLHALRHARCPHRLVPDHGGDPAGAVPAWLPTTGEPQPAPAPLRLPATG